MTFKLPANIAALAAAVQETGKDLTKASAGGGDYSPPAAGQTRLRFVGYVETGVHTTKFQGKDKIKPRAEFTFELSGKNHPPKVLDDGRKIPERITFKEAVGTHVKNGYMKLFKVLSDGTDATNFVQLLGNAYLGVVGHYKFNGSDGKEVTIAQLRAEGVYHIRSTTYEDPESGEMRTVKVDEPLMEIKAFLWDYADEAQWDSLFIDGTRDDGSTKNKVQETIKKANNFVGSPIHTVLIEAGREADTVPAAKGAGDKPDAEDPPEEEEPAAPKPATKPAVKTPAKKTPVKPKPAAPPPEPGYVDGTADDADPLAGY